MIDTKILSIIKFVCELHFDQHILLIHYVFVDQRRNCLIELVRRINLKVSVHFDEIPPQHPILRAQALLPNLDVNIHIFAVNQNKLQNDLMHLLKQEIRTIHIQFQDVDDHLLKMRLVEFDFWDSVQKSYYIFPLRKVNLLAHHQNEHVDVFYF